MARRGSRTLFTTSGSRSVPKGNNGDPSPNGDTPTAEPAPIPAAAPVPEPAQIVADGGVHRPNGRFGLAGWLCLATALLLATALAVTLLANQQAYNDIRSANSRHQAAVTTIEARDQTIVELTEAKEASIANLGSTKAELQSAGGTIQILNQEIASLRDDIAGRDELLRQFDQPYREQLEGVMAERDSAISELERVSKEHRESLRLNALGSHLGYFTVGQNSYEGAIISSIDPAGFDIVHEDGVTRIDFGMLPPDDRAQYGFDRAEAIAHHQKMAEEQRIRQAIADQRVVAAEQQAAEQAAAAAEAAEERRLDYSRNWIARLDLEIEELQKSMGRLGRGSAARSRYLSMIEDKRELRTRLVNDLKAMEAGLR